MGKIWMPGGGGGADLDMVTAGKPDVLAGKVIVDKDGEPLTGNMPNRGAVNPALNAGESYSIPDGFHNGAGKVIANSLASQTPGTASAGQILNGQSAWVNGNRITGNIAYMGGQTITPGSSQQTVSCSGRYMTGDIIINGVRTYAVKYGSISTTGGKVFRVWNFDNVSKYYNYLDIPTGFTPLTATFRNISGSNPPFSQNTFFEGGQYVTDYNGYNGMISSSGGAQSDSTRMLIPVPGSGNYEYHISGYY